MASATRARAAGLLLLCCLPLASSFGSTKLGSGTAPCPYASKTNAHGHEGVLEDQHEALAKYFASTTAEVNERHGLDAPKQSYGPGTGSSGLMGSAGSEEDCIDPDPYKLGPLKALVGTWSGAAGFNIVSVPSLDSNGFEILKNTGGEGVGQNYTERLSFCPIPAQTLNRGFKGDPRKAHDATARGDQILGGIMYKQSIFSTLPDGTETDELLHVENGMFMPAAAFQDEKHRLVKPIGSGTRASSSTGCRVRAQA